MLKNTHEYSYQVQTVMAVLNVPYIHDTLGPGWKLVYLIDLFYLANFLDDPPSRVSYLPFASH